MLSGEAELEGRRPSIFDNIDLNEPSSSVMDQSVLRPAAASDMAMYA